MSTLNLMFRFRRVMRDRLDYMYVDDVLTCMENIPPYEGSAVQI